VIRENEQNMETYSPFSAHILQDEDEYDHGHSPSSDEPHQYRYDPNASEEDIDHPFAHILPDFPGRIRDLFFGKKSENENETENLGKGEERNGMDGDIVYDANHLADLDHVNIDIEPSVNQQYAKDLNSTELGKREGHNSSTLSVPRNENDAVRSRSSSFRRFVEGVTSVFDTEVVDV
jgi:hypothetical protein